MKKILDDKLCDKLCVAAREKSQEMVIDICFAIYDENANMLLFRRYGDAPLLGTTLVPQKAYTAALMFMPTEKLAELSCEGGPLMGLQNNNSNITYVSGGYPLYVKGKCIGAIGVGGGRGDEDNIIAEYVLQVFQESVKE